MNFLEKIQQSKAAKIIVVIFIVFLGALAIYFVLFGGPSDQPTQVSDTENGQSGFAIEDETGRNFGNEKPIETGGTKYQGYSPEYAKERNEFLLACLNNVILPVDKRVLENIQERLEKAQVSGDEVSIEALKLELLNKIEKTGNLYSFDPDQAVELDDGSCSGGLIESSSSPSIQTSSYRCYIFSLDGDGRYVTVSNKEECDNLNKKEGGSSKDQRECENKANENYLECLSDADDDFQDMIDDLISEDDDISVDECTAGLANQDNISDAELNVVYECIADKYPDFDDYSIEDSVDDYGDCVEERDDDIEDC